MSADETKRERARVLRWACDMLDRCETWAGDDGSAADNRRNLDALNALAWEARESLVSPGCPTCRPHGWLDAGFPDGSLCGACGTYRLGTFLLCEPRAARRES